MEQSTREAGGEVGGGKGGMHKLPDLEGLSGTVAAELELNNGRLEKLMGKEVDILFTRAAVQSHKQDLACGGQNVMGSKQTWVGRPQSGSRTSTFWGTTKSRTSICSSPRGT